MKTELQRATEALKVALHCAIDDVNFNKSHLSELWRHYNGVACITESCAEDETPSSLDYDAISFDYSSEYTNYYDNTIVNGENVSGAEGTDTISFGAAQPVDPGIGGIVQGGQDVISFS
jgi:hypothetical protein